MKRIVAGVLIALAIPASSAHATTVCFTTLTGQKCVTFRTPPPATPNTTKGMTIVLDREVLISGDSVTAVATKFKAREYVRAFVFNVYGRSAATELSGGAIATKAGVATLSYGTTSLPVSVSETRTLCLRGEQSKKMACASFQFEG